MCNQDKRSSRPAGPRADADAHHAKHPVSNFASDEEDVGVTFANSAAAAAAAAYGSNIHSYSGGSETPASTPAPPHHAHRAPGRIAAPDT